MTKGFRRNTEKIFLNVEIERCPGWKIVQDLINEVRGIRMSWVKNFLKTNKRRGSGGSSAKIAWLERAIYYYHFIIINIVAIRSITFIIIIIIAIITFVIIIIIILLSLLLLLLLLYYRFCLACTSLTIF